MKKIKYIVLFFIFCSTYNFAQVSAELKDYVPMTPESYAFKKRFNNEVSTFTGVINQTIPIYNIKVNDLEIPISINYSSNGIKVDEESSIVGLGWSLNIGGEISRKNNGAPDERFFFQTGYDSNNGIGANKNFIAFIDMPDYLGKYFARAHLFRDAINSSNPYILQDTKDFRPDEFFYNFLGNSGSFMYKQENNKFLCFPLSNIKFDYQLQNTVQQGNYINQLIMKLPDGNKVIFGEDGRRSVRYISGPYFDNSWQIKRILTKDNINIEYEYIESNYPASTRAVWTGYEGSVPFGVISSTTNGNSTDYWNKETLIKQINFPNGRIVFVYSDREDLLPGSKKLSEIQVLNNETIIKKIIFNHSYFLSNQSSLNTPNYSVGNLTRTKRLKLDNIEFKNSTNGVSDKYSFEYYLFDKIPTKDSFSRDYWGYFNGDFTQPLRPKIFDPSCLYNCYSKIDSLYSKTFSLRKIIYPEKGFTVYDFENNKADISQSNAPYEIIPEITDEMYQTEWKGLSISGYQLNNYNPEPISDIYYPARRKYLYSDPFIIDEDIEFNSANNFFINSNLPFQIPNYSTFLASYNYVKCSIEVFNGTSFTNYFSYTISKDENNTGYISSQLSLPLGTYRFKIELYQGYMNSNGTSSLNLNNNHSTSISIRLKRKVTDEIKIGGLRIKEINSFSSEGVLSYKTKYKYELESGESSGRISNLPAFKEVVSQYVPMPSSPMQKEVFFRTSSESILPMIKTQGSELGYTRVVEEKVNIMDNSVLTTESNFSFSNKLFSDYVTRTHLREFEPKKWQNGKLLNKIYYRNGTIIKKEIFDYYGLNLENDKGYVDEINTDLFDSNELNQVLFPNQISKLIPVNLSLMKMSLFQPDGNQISMVGTFGMGNSTTECKHAYFRIYTGFDALKSQTVQEFFDSGMFETKEEFVYDNVPLNMEVSSKTLKNSNNISFETKIYYPDDSEMISEPYVNELITKNMISTPLASQTYLGSDKLSETKIIYNNWGNNLLKPQIIKSSKGLSELENKVHYTVIDNLNGNPLEMRKENGMIISCIWGYNNTQLVAKLENISYSAIPASLITAIQTATDSPTATETQIISAINALRNSTDANIAKSMITSFTYKPLIGVSSITDPKGDTINYHYDSFGRLQFVKDKNGKILTENEYNYKP